MKMSLCCMALAMILGLGGCGLGRRGLGPDLCEAQEPLIRWGLFGDASHWRSHDHVWEEIVLTEGNCTDPRVISHVCKECGAKKSSTVDYENRARLLHDCQPGTGSCVEPKYNVVIFYRCDRCSRCGEERNRQQTGFEPLDLEEAP